MRLLLTPLVLALFAFEPTNVIAAESNCLRSDPFLQTRETATLCHVELNDQKLDARQRARITAQLGEASYWASVFPMAINLMTEALKLDDSLNETRIQLGWAYLRVGDVTKAQELFVEALARDPKSGRATFGLGYIFINNGESEKGKFAYKQAITLTPDYLLAHSGLASYYQAVEWDPALALKEINYILEQPRDKVNKVAFFSGGYYPKKKFYNSVLLDKASLLNKLDRNQESEAILNALVLEEPENPEFLASLAVTLGNSSKFADAIAAVDKAHKIAPNCECGLAVKLQSQVRLKRFDEAIETANLWKKRFGSRRHYSEVIFFEGLALRSKGQTDLARINLLSSFKVDPKYLQFGLNTFIKHGYYDGKSGDAYSDRVEVALDACLIDPQCMVM